MSHVGVSLKGDWLLGRAWYQQTGEEPSSRKSSAVSRFGLLIARWIRSSNSGEITVPVSSSRFNAYSSSSACSCSEWIFLWESSRSWSLCVTIILIPHSASRRGCVDSDGVSFFSFSCKYRSVMRWYSEEKNCSLSFSASNSPCNRTLSFSAFCNSTMDSEEPQLSGVVNALSEAGCFRTKDWMRHWMSRLDAIMRRSVVM